MKKSVIFLGIPLTAISLYIELLKFFDTKGELYVYIYTISRADSKINKRRDRHAPISFLFYLIP